MQLGPDPCLGPVSQPHAARRSRPSSPRPGSAHRTRPLPCSARRRCQPAQPDLAPDAARDSGGDEAALAAVGLCAPKGRREQDQQTSRRLCSGTTSGTNQHADLILKRSVSRHVVLFHCSNGVLKKICPENVPEMTGAHSAGCGHISGQLALLPALLPRLEGEHSGSRGRYGRV